MRSLGLISLFCLMMVAVNVHAADDEIDFSGDYVCNGQYVPDPAPPSGMELPPVLSRVVLKGLTRRNVTVEVYDIDDKGAYLSGSSLLSVYYVKGTDFFIKGRLTRASNHSINDPFEAHFDSAKLVLKLINTSDVSAYTCVHN
jgi:hypothetical protein